MNDHQTPSQNPEDPDERLVQSLLSDRFALLWEDLRPSVRPAWLGPGPDPTAGIVSTVQPNTGPPPSITWADVKATMAKLPRDYGPADTWHWQRTPGGWYSVPPNTAITGELIDDECGKPWAEHPPARVVPSVPFFDQVREVRALVDEINTPDDDEAHTCPGTGPWPAPCGRDTNHPPHPLGIPPEPEWHKGCTWCCRTIWHTPTEPTTGEQP
jgi:hypothetical protein